MSAELSSSRYSASVRSTLGARRTDGCASSPTSFLVSSGGRSGDLSISDTICGSFAAQSSVAAVDGSRLASLSRLLSHLCHVALSAASIPPSSPSAPATPSSISPPPAPTRRAPRPTAETSTSPSSSSPVEARSRVSELRTRTCAELRGPCTSFFAPPPSPAAIFSFHPLSFVHTRSTNNSFRSSWKPGMREGRWVSSEVSGGGGGGGSSSLSPSSKSLATSFLTKSDDGAVGLSVTLQIREHTDVCSSFTCGGAEPRRWIAHKNCAELRGGVCAFGGLSILSSRATTIASSAGSCSAFRFLNDASNTRSTTSGEVARRRRRSGAVLSLPPKRAAADTWRFCVVCWRWMSRMLPPLPHAPAPPRPPPPPRRPIGASIPAGAERGERVGRRRDPALLRARAALLVLADDEGHLHPDDELLRRHAGREPGAKVQEDLVAAGAEGLRPDEAEALVEPQLDDRPLDEDAARAAVAVATARRRGAPPPPAALGGAEVVEAVRVLVFAAR